MLIDHLDSVFVMSPVFASIAMFQDANGHPFATTKKPVSLYSVLTGHVLI